MSDILTTLIAGARKRQQDKQRAALTKLVRTVQKVIGKDLYALLDIRPNEYNGNLEFTARGTTFSILQANALEIQAIVTADIISPHAWLKTKHIFSPDELLLWIDERTRKVESRV